MFLFCPFHSDDAFCALLPEVKADISILISLPNHKKSHYHTDPPKFQSIGLLSQLNSRLLLVKF